MNETSKSRFMDAIKENMKVAGVNEEDAVDREKWREMICCGDPNGKGREKDK